MKYNQQLIAKLVAALLACTLTIFVATHSRKNKPATVSSTAPLPRPQEGEENENQRELYEALRHKTAPNTDWRKVEAENAAARLGFLRQQGARVLEEFANGAIAGTWSERGASNQTGSIRAVDYVAATNKLYTISNGGSLWSSVLGSGAWQLLNQEYRFDQRTVSAFKKISGGVRMVAAVGEQVMYSDDEGATFVPSTGIQFPVGWGGNYVAKFVHLNNGTNTLYCLTRPWSNSPWGPRYWLYQSTDEGASFAKIYEFSAGDDDRISLCNPYNTTAVYAVDISSSPGLLKLFNVSGSTVTLSQTYSLGAGNVSCLLKGTKVGNTTSLYLLVNNADIYRSTDLGETWTLRSHLPEGAWMKMNVSMNDPELVSYGGVNAFRSINGASSFTKVNEWFEYYGNVPNKLHADIMEIEYFKKTNNTEFAVVNSHGGTYVSYDNLLSVSNQSLLSHNATEYYDVLTDTLHPDRIYVATQDQGFQRTVTGLTPGIQPFTQVLGGDYGQMALTANNEFVWPQYPGGHFYLFSGLSNPVPSYLKEWVMPGTQKPNYGWMLPVTSTADPAANEVWMGGGNISGGDGSYLVKISMEATSPYTITPTQLSYDFRANSRTGNAGITAIEQSLLNPKKLYVATEDGTFFYSADGGIEWEKTLSFEGPSPWYLYGSCVLASRKNEQLVWYAGSGYSNPPVYVSTDGGASFKSISNGLPPTLVNEIVASPNENFLFAATEAGPYVYVKAANKWFSLASGNTPVQFFSGVEYIPGQNIVRFSTMGRGVWDFAITAPTLPVTFLQLNGQYANGRSLLNWSTASESNSSHFIVQRSLDGLRFTGVGKVTAAGNSTTPRQYRFTDDLSTIVPPAGEIFYRLLQVDLDGETKASKVVKVQAGSDALRFTLLNNPVRNAATLKYQSTVAEKIIVSLYDADGKTAMTQQFAAAAGPNQYTLDVSALSNGVYIVALSNGKEKRTLRLLKQ